MNKRVVYEVRWKDSEVGLVFANDKNEYIYEPNIDNIRENSRKGMPATLVIRPQREWSKDMPKFISKRAKINTSLDSRVITDHFSIVAR